MLVRVDSAAAFGIKAYLVSGEVDLSSGRKLDLKRAGPPDTTVRESSEWIHAVLRKCGYTPIPDQIANNLAPVDSTTLSIIVGFSVSGSRSATSLGRVSKHP